MNPSDCILFSGGAPGAEAEFGAAAERHGIEEVNFTFEGHPIVRHRGVRVFRFAGQFVRKRRVKRRESVLRLLRIGDALVHPLEEGGRRGTARMLAALFAVIAGLAVEEWMRSMLRKVKKGQLGADRSEEHTSELQSH